MSIQFQNYGQKRDLLCTEQEQQIYNLICSALSDVGIDISSLSLVRKSDSYVTLCVKNAEDYDMDIVRLKFTPRAKWIKIGPFFDRLNISAPDDVLEHREELAESYRRLEPYL